MSLWVSRTIYGTDPRETDKPYNSLLQELEGYFIATFSPVDTGSKRTHGGSGRNKKTGRRRINITNSFRLLLPGFVEGVSDYEFTIELRDAGFFKDITVKENESDHLNEKFITDGLELQITEFDHAHIEKITLKISYWPNGIVTDKKVIKEISL